ncbi:MAG: hypothetical protein ABJE66_18115 [Deltaproteobacteria bacterium]
MKIRRIASAAAAMLVAIVVALAVPVSQLRTVTTISEPCCCPDPAHCHCPTDSADPTHDAQLKNCRKVSHDIVASQLPAFSAPAIADAPASIVIVAIAVSSIPAPHAAPTSRRPDAPS